MQAILESMRLEVTQKTLCRAEREGLFKAVLKASFARIYGYLEFVNLRLPEDSSDSFFISAPLRQCCEDLIALKFLSRLKRKDRDAVIQALMTANVADALKKQATFFSVNHPHQLILEPTLSSNQIDSAKQALNGVGQRSGLWRTRNRLPPIDQMASKVNLSNLYDFLYAATSEVVHFKVRIALRSGWGDGKNEFKFSPHNFSKYYRMFAKTYSAYLFVTYCRQLKSDLQLSSEFMTAIDSMEVLLQSEFRWPEIVTFEEMNIPQNDNIILRAFLAMRHPEQVEQLRTNHVKRTMRRRSAVAAS